MDDIWTNAISSYGWIKVFSVYYTSIVQTGKGINKKRGPAGGTSSLLKIVPRTGLEPARYCYHWSLKPACLPISPPGHGKICFGAQNKNRTCTPLREHGPQPCASTISAIWAKFGGAKIINFKTIYRLVETILTWNKFDELKVIL